MVRLLDWLMFVLAKPVEEWSIREQLERNCYLRDKDEGKKKYSRADKWTMYSVQRRASSGSVLLTSFSAEGISCLAGTEKKKIKVFCFFSLSVFHVES